MPQVVKKFDDVDQFVLSHLFSKFYIEIHIHFFAAQWTKPTARPPKSVTRASDLAKKKDT